RFPSPAPVFVLQKAAFEGGFLIYSSARFASVICPRRVFQASAQPSNPSFPMIHDPSPDHDEADEANESAATNTGDTLRHRRIRSFVTRAGRVSTGQRRPLDEFGPRFVVPFKPQPLDWDAAFGREAPRVLEIGFGMGATTAEIAAARPTDDFLGVEVHEPGVGALLKLIGEQGLTNIRVVQHDAV